VPKIASQQDTSIIIHVLICFFEGLSMTPVFHFRRTMQAFMIFYGFFFAMIVSLHAQAKNTMLSESLGKLTEWKSEPNGAVLTTLQGMMRLTFYSPSIVRVRAVRTGSAWDDHSFAVGMQPQNVKITSKDDADALTFTSDALKVVVKKNPVRVQFFTLDGKLLNEDEAAFGTTWLGTEVTTHKRLLADERFIGLGEKAGGTDKRRQAFTNWNTDAFGYAGGSDPLYVSIPFYMGLHSNSLVYGIFLDNSYRTNFNFGASNDRFSSFSAEAGEMNYYFIHRPSVAETIQAYTELTGRMEIPPLWALGYQQCRYSYFPDSEVMNVARTMREKGFAGDAIVLDIHYMDAYKVFTFHPERFPNPKKMIADLKTLGFNTVVINDPGIKVEKGYSAYEDGLKQGIFAKYPDGTPYSGEVWPGWCHFPDFTNPKARVWWGDNMKTLTDAGVTGFWNDMNEPAAWGQNIPNIVEFDFDGNKASYKKAHNVYGLEMARSSYEGAKRHLGGKRPFVLTRAAFAGIQRYSSIWTGDNTATDDHLMLGTRLVAGLGLSGVPFTGVDIGGFNGNGSRELFARWVTVGAFTPFFRIHAAIYTKEQDPWSFGEDVEEICKNYIQLRYNLMPYIYSAFHEAAQTGLPVARNLAITYPFDAKIYDGAFNSQYLFGGAFLIAPVVSTQQFAKVYLPEKGEDWYDFHSNKRLSGGQEILVEAPLERLPVFVRGGSIIPQQSPVLHAGQKPTDTLTLHVYRGNTSNSFTYYEDDGETYKYQQNDFHKRVIRYDAAKNSLTFEKADGVRASKFKAVRCILHGFSGMKETISVGGKATKTSTEFVSFLPNLSGFDPLGAQGEREAADALATTLIFPLTAEKLVLTW
jgi:alpha-glucosidase